LLPAARPGGRPRTTCLRRVVNAVFYLLQAGCQWRMLPKDFPPRNTVYGYFRAWIAAGVWAHVHDVLYRRTRELEGRAESPTVAIIDSQSVKTSAEAREMVGYDAGKRVKGRKRHLVTDTLGLMLRIEVHSASVQDRDGAALVLDRITRRFPFLERIFADAGYQGPRVAATAPRPVEISALANAPRTVCGCQPVASTIRSIVAASARSSIAISCACLVLARVLPGRAVGAARGALSAAVPPLAGPALLPASVAATPAVSGPIPIASRPAGVMCTKTPRPSSRLRQRVLSAGSAGRASSITISSAKPRESSAPMSLLAAPPRSEPGSGSRLPLARCAAVVRIIACVSESFGMGSFPLARIRTILTFYDPSRTRRCGDSSSFEFDRDAVLPHTRRSLP
jgi:transposase